MTHSLESIVQYHPCGEDLATAGQPRPEQFRMLADAGFEVVINLGMADGKGGSLVDEEELVHACGMEYIHIPIPFDDPQRRHFLDFATALRTHRQQRCFIHCVANKRVSAFVGLYRVLIERRPLEAAFGLMYEIWTPEGVWADFLEEMLEEWRSRPEAFA